MDILKRLTLRDLKLNKKRTIGILVGVILSCALIVVVIGMAITSFYSLLQGEINRNGYYHIEVDEISEKDIQYFRQKDYVKDVIVSNNVGYAYTDDYYYDLNHVYSLNRDAFDKLSYHIIEGEFPKNENEILVNRSFKYSNDLKVGDYFEIEVGDLKNNTSIYDTDGSNNLVNSRKINYKVVGIIDKYGDLVTINKDFKTHNAYIVLENPSNYRSDLIKLFGANFLKKEVSKFGDVSINKTVLLYETWDLSEQVSRIFISMVGIVLFIIMATSIFSIRNSFAISVSEKTKTYGMLSSVGATKKQIIKMVMFEALVIGAIGIFFGILLGVGVNILLVYIINAIANNANLFAEGLGLFYKFSWTPIWMSIVLSIVVIIFSSLICAFKAGRVSPIQNIKNSSNIKRSSLKTPWFIKKLFGIGGVISYKNLKRSKKKYRVTVISLTVCIAIYIMVSTFVEYTLSIAHGEDISNNYNLEVDIASASRRTDDEDPKEYFKELKGKIAQVEALDKAYTRYTYYFGELDFGNHIISDKIIYRDYDYSRVNHAIVLYNKEGFKEYIKRLGLNYDEVKDKIILVNEVKERFSEKRNEYISLTDYKVNDSIKIGDNKFKIAALTKELPIGFAEDFASSLLIVGSYENFPISENGNVYLDYIYFDSDEPYKLAKSLRELSDDNYEVYVYNSAEQEAQMKSIILIVSIIVYGFIIVVTFIGITSVFNTINSNMELRSSDFASLKSIGMTKKEFNNMINLEAILYSFKSLVYGIVLGLLGSYGIFKLFTRDYNFEFLIPVKSIIIAIAFIIVIVLVIMRYSIKKINKQNIIETIRNSNI